MDDAIMLAASLVGCSAVLFLISWRVRWPRPLVFLGVAVFISAALIAANEVESTAFPSDSPLSTTAIIVLTGVLALAGGGPLTTVIFGLIDGESDEKTPGAMGRAGEVLRGGAWIGVLERAAIYGSLVAGWPEGMALVLALKGLGRYPELRNQEHTGTAERFIIGTFTSVLWACACAGMATLLR